MGYLALYRKYRPLDFDDVYGQEEIVTVIKNAITNNKVSHAYLFSGPRGTGKTTIAKIIARLVNCEHLENGKPCGKCYNCKKNFDVESTSVQHNDGPRGNMTVSIVNYEIGHCEKENCIICDCENTILATFNMYEKEYYRGENAYFPNNKYGLELLGIFKIAFDNNLLFQLGVSVSEGTYGIVFAGIHFKTRISGGATEHAYPDHGYLKRIKESAWNYLIPCTELNDIINNRKIGKCILQKYLDKTFTTLLPDDDNYKEGCVDGKKFEQEVLNTELTEEEKKDDYYVEEDVKGKKFEQNVLNIKLTKEENKNNNYVKGNVDGKNFLNIKLTEEENKVNEYSKNSVCSWYTSILCCC